MMVSWLELRRKLFHFSFGAVLVALIYFNIINVKGVLILLAILLLAGIAVTRWEVPLLTEIFKKLERTKNINKFPGKGSVFYLVGALVALVLFEKDIAMASIIILAIGDAVAPYIRKFSRVPSNKRLFVGLVVGTICSTLGAMVFISPLEAALAALAAMMVEGIDVKIGINKIDDNIIIPPVAGLVVWILRSL